MTRRLLCALAILAPLSLCETPVAAQSIRSIGGLPATGDNYVRVTVSLSHPVPLPGDEANVYVDVWVRRGEMRYRSRTFSSFPIGNVKLEVPFLEQAPRGLEVLHSLQRVALQHPVKEGQTGFQLNRTQNVVLEAEPPDHPSTGLFQNFQRRRLVIPVRVLGNGNIVLPTVRISGSVFLPDHRAIASVGGTSPGAWRPFTADSGITTIVVNDLRARSDCPLDFCGAIGEQFRLLTAVSNRDVVVKTPFSFKLRLEGDDGVARARTPDLGTLPEWKPSFVVKSEGDRQLVTGMREFTYSLQVKDDSVSQIPPIHLSYFNPKTDKFETLQSDPVPIHVHQTAPVTASAAPLAPTSSPVDPSTPAQSLLPTVTQAQARIPETLRQPFPWMFLILGMIGLFLSWHLLAWVRRRVVPRILRVHRRRRMVRRAVAQLCPSKVTLPIIKQTFQAFLHSRFGLPPGEITALDLERLHAHGVSQDLVRGCVALLTDCAQIEFAPGLQPRSPAELAQQARQLIEQLLTAPLECSPIDEPCASTVQRERETALAY